MARAPDIAAEPGLVVHVLEPSPPAVRTEPFADDPAVPADPSHALTPTTAGFIQWNEVAAEHPGAAPFIAANWLGAWPPLPPLPHDLADTRRSLHLLAFYVLSPVRRSATGRIGLRWTRDGFGTPYFASAAGADTQVRVEGPHLVVQTTGPLRVEPITTLRAAGALVGHDPGARGELDVAPMPHPDQPLVVEAAGVAFLGDWFGFATAVLEQFRVDARAHGVARVQLWPEHFDVATEAGESSRNQRASYGVSPGDDNHPEPYLYVSSWQPVDRDERFWNDPHFEGASLTYTALAGAEDPYAAARRFFADGLALLTRS
jgi:hypothetical protein